MADLKGEFSGIGNSGFPESVEGARHTEAREKESPKGPQHKE